MKTQTCWERRGESLPNINRVFFFCLQSCSSSEEQNEWVEAKTTISSKCSRGEWQNKKQKDVFDGQVALIEVQNKRAHTRLTKMGRDQVLTNQFHSHVNEQPAFKSLCFLFK